MGLFDAATAFVGRTSDTVEKSFNTLTAQQWIRLIAIVGAYLLLRPYLLKKGSQVQMQQYEDESNRTLDAREAAAKAKRLAAKKLRFEGMQKQQRQGGGAAPAAPLLSANDLRGNATSSAAAVLLDDSDSEEGGNGASQTGAETATEWGKNARRRQRKALRQMLEAQERKLALEDDDTDEDVSDLLQ